MLDSVALVSPISDPMSRRLPLCAVVETLRMPSRWRGDRVTGLIDVRPVVNPARIKVGMTRPATRPLRRDAFQQGHPGYDQRVGVHRLQCRTEQRTRATSGLTAYC